MKHTQRNGRTGRIGAAGLGLALLGATAIGGANFVRAQDVPTPHPAHIHAGTCETLDPNPLFPLADVTLPSGAASGTTASAKPVEQSVTVVQVALADIVAGEHAINIHESAENIDTYIACGDIGGAVAGPDLTIGLGQQNESGYSGIGWLHDNGDGTTTVSIFISQDLDNTTAVPVAEATPADASPVAIVDAAATPAPEVALPEATPAASPIAVVEATPAGTPAATPDAGAALVATPVAEATPDQGNSAAVDAATPVIAPASPETIPVASPVATPEASPIGSPAASPAASPVGSPAATASPVAAVGLVVEVRA